MDDFFHQVGKSHLTKPSRVFVFKHSYVNVTAFARLEIALKLVFLNVDVRKISRTLSVLKRCVNVEPCFLATDMRRGWMGRKAWMWQAGPVCAQRGVSCHSGSRLAGVCPAHRSWVPADSTSSQVPVTTLACHTLWYVLKKVSPQSTWWCPERGACSVRVGVQGVSESGVPSALFSHKRDESLNTDGVH